MPLANLERLMEVRVTHRMGPLALDVSFSLTQPWTVMFGPSGSGKTTLLRSIAGFVRPDTARVTYGPQERVLVDTDRAVFVRADRRPVRIAAQSARLFPQLTVKQNVRFGMEWGSHPADQRAVLEEVLRMMRIQSLGDRRSKSLSGGERQRVSVARAVAAAVAFDGADKAMLLVDEPFAGLDSTLRDELAVELRDWLRRWKVPVLSVSHDVSECFLLGAEVIRIADGKVMEQGPVEEVLAGERERVLARLS